MNDLTTVIYYTSNKEDPEFELKIREQLLHNIGKTLLISVSQRPIDFGKNICVGYIGACEQNVWKQMLAGCKLATTPFVTFAEADTLYPPEYFQYKPTDLNKRYWFEDVYILFKKRHGFYNKGRSDSAHMAGREYVIKLLEEAISKGKAMEYRGINRPTKVELKIPVISIKTGNGMRPTTQTSLTPVDSLPYWGSAEQLKRIYFYDKFLF
jgi:hypothetical protein